MVDYGQKRDDTNTNFQKATQSPSRYGGRGRALDQLCVAFCFLEG